MAERDPRELVPELGVDRVAFCGKDGWNSAGGMAVRRRKMG
jgi:hypothetical protein